MSRAGGTPGLDGLIKALATAIPGALLPWVVMRFTLAAYEQVGMELPVLTQLWLRGYWLAWLLPVGVLLIWRLRLDRADRDRSAFTVAWIGALLITALSIVAAWLPMLSAPGAIS